jgi:hypothetical protein
MLAQRRRSNTQISSNTPPEQPAGQSNSHGPALEIFFMLHHISGMPVRVFNPQVNDSKP